MSLLSFIITHHNEELSVIEPLFQSLNIQVGIDWEDVEIVICDDTGKMFSYETILNRCNNIKNRVVFVNSTDNSILHNMFNGIYNCSSKYFTCWDCDDRLYDCFSLKTMLDGIRNNLDKDFILFNRVNEAHFSDPEWKPAFVFTGGICKKEFIIKNNITPVNLHIGTDVYLDTIIKMINDKTYACIPKIIYLYIDRDSSVWHSCNKTNAEDYLYLSSLNLLKYAINYHLNHKDTTQFPEDRLWDRLPYFYWRLQEYINENADHPSENVSQMVIKAETALKDFYMSVVDKSFFEKNWYQEYISLSKTIKDESFHQWLNRVFNLEFEV